MTMANIAEGLKLAAKPVQYDNDEKTWLEFRFKLENYLTLVDEKYVALLQDAESQAVANLPAGAEEPAVTIRTLSYTLYALLATLTTGRSLGLVRRVPNRNGFEAWRQFEETWKSWEHQADVYENLSSSKVGDDVKFNVVLREAPQKLRDHPLVNSQQFESNYSKLRVIIQAYLNTNKTWIANDFRETAPLEVDYIGKSKGKGKSKSKSKGNRKGNSKGGSKDNGKDKSKGKSKDRKQGRCKSNSNGRGSGKPDNDKECYVCEKKCHFARGCWSRANHDKMVKEGRSRERQCRAW